MLSSLASASAAGSVLQQPPQPALKSVSIAAGKVSVKQDPRYLTMLPFQAQKLPLDYCADWPIWVTKREGKVPVSRVPAPPPDVEEWWLDWVPPAAFEQLWLPEDLPQPQARPAIGLVLRNGEPRYVFPTIDTYLELDGVVWRNRGLNSVPLAKTWLHFGESPIETLRLSAYHRREPVRNEAADEEEATGSEAEEAAEDVPWSQCVEHVAIDAAMREADEALEALPDLLRKKSLGDGYCYLVVPLHEQPPLPAHALEPGGRLRLFLSDLDSWPTNVARERGDEPRVRDEDEWAWTRGECDLTTHTVPSGKDSPYLPKPYKELYQHEWA